MLVIFPFEEPFYRGQGVPAEFVGHPLAELPLPAMSREAFAATNGLDPAKTWIGLLPGSRPKEIRDILPEILRAAQKLKGSFEFLIPLAPTLNAEQREEVRQIVQDHGAGLPLRLIDDIGPTPGGARSVLFHARASVVASGTATVEAALIGNPFVVVYQVSPLTFAIAKRVVKLPCVAMANLIAGRQVVPELLQGDFTAENIVKQIGPLLPEGPARQSMMKDLAQVRGLLNKRPADRAEQGGAINRVAAITLEVMAAPRPGAGKGCKDELA
jgi:lipid-A-disaccharide synthase